MENNLDSFDKWNGIKKTTSTLSKKVYFKERDIFFIRIGENIGFEQSGKGEDFLRPVLVFKKFNNSFFMGIPLTTTQKESKFYYKFEFTNKVSSAILSQIRAFDVKRIKHKIGMISKDDFSKLKNEVQKLYELAPSKEEDDPEGICSKSISQRGKNGK